MRTTITIDDRLLQEAREAVDAGSVKSIVEKALQLLVQTHRQTVVRDLRGSIQWEGDLNVMREDQNTLADSAHNAA